MKIPGTPTAPIIGPVNTSLESGVKSVNPLKCMVSDSKCYTFNSVECHPGLTYILNFRHSGTLTLRAERQSARMSKIKNVD